MSNNANCYKLLKLRGLKRKYEYIMRFGGKCECCGYDKNIAALEFHHINPLYKSIKLDMRSFSNSNLDKLEEELKKCKILCSNCHKEHHNPTLILDNIPEIIKDAENKKSFNNRDENFSICPVCNKKFKKIKGKIYCSKKCRMDDKKYPSIDEVNELYKLLKSWDKVAKHFNLTCKIISGIRNRNK